MKADIVKNEIANKINSGNIRFVNQEVTNEIKIVDYLEEPENGQFMISLYSHLFLENQVKVFLRNNKLILFINEQVDSTRSSMIYVSDWQSYYPQSYTRMRNVSLLLPGDNFFLLRHFLISEKFLLKIFLARLADN